MQPRGVGTTWRALLDFSGGLVRGVFEPARQGLIAGEGNGFISANLISEAEQDFLPLIAGRLSRHLYHVRL